MFARTTCGPKRTRISLKRRTPAQTVGIPLMWGEENCMTPKSVVASEKSFKNFLLCWIGWTMLNVFLICLTVHLRDNPRHMKLANNILVPVTSLSCIFWGVSVFGFPFLDTDARKEASRYFEATFGFNPDEQDDAQRIINGVLEGLRRKTQGAFGREISVQRCHLADPSDETVTKLRKAQRESRELKEVFWAAVKTADDWEFKVPTSIDEEIH